MLYFSCRIFLFVLFLSQYILAMSNDSRKKSDFAGLCEHGRDCKNPFKCLIHAGCVYGRCVCPQFMMYTGSTCVMRKTANEGESCSIKRCKSWLECQKCGGSDLRCHERATPMKGAGTGTTNVGNVCQKTKQCKPGLFCIKSRKCTNGVCNCPSNYYFKFATSKCEKIKYGTKKLGQSCGLWFLGRHDGLRPCKKSSVCAPCPNKPRPTQKTCQSLYPRYM